MSLDEKIALCIRRLAQLREEKKELKNQMTGNRQETAQCLVFLKDLQAQKEAESK